MRHLSVLTSAVLLAAIPSAAGGTAAAQREYWGNFERYAADNARVAALPLSERRVVFMGNSITDFWPGNHPSFFADNHFIGRGTFVTAPPVGVAVRLVYAFTLTARFPSVLNEPLSASVTF